VITREDSDGNLVDVIKVPLTYANKEKMLARITQDPNLTGEAAIVLPRMSFILHNYVYDGDRKLKTLNRTVIKDESDVNKFKYQYQPVPYNLNFSLWIYAKNAEDCTKIMEQILPYFTPDWTARVNLVPEMDLAFAVPIVFNNCTSEEVYETNFITRQAIIWEMQFTMKTFMFGPIKKSPIIKFATTSARLGNEDEYSEVVDQVIVTPGLDANGNPTTNASISISPLLIDLEDDWDYAVQRSGLIIVEEE
jgi:hypothetical protein